MKKIVILIICCLSAGMASPLMIFAEESERSELFEEILIGGGWSSLQPSGLEVLDDNESLDSLTARGRRQSDGLPLIGGEIGYASEGTGTARSIGTGFDEPLNFSVSQELGDAGQLSLSALYAEVEVWGTPYLTTVAREKTDAESIGFSVAWKEIFATGVNWIGTVTAIQATVSALKWFILMSWGAFPSRRR